MTQEETVWQARAQEFMAVRHLSQENVLHPFVVNLLQSLKGRRLLDYGCGDGRILHSLNSDWWIDAFEPSAAMRALAQQRVGGKVHNLFADASDVVGPYDVVLLGMVLLCIPTEDEVRATLQHCARTMAPGSHLIITTSHPCFRNQAFSNFRTEFSDGEIFDYKNDGRPFRITISDPDGTAVSFTDYHWSLDFTFRVLNSAGFYVEKLCEVGDDPSADGHNSLVPAFLVLDCVRK